MSKLVVDASVAIKWLVAETLTDEALAILGSDNELVAPDLLPIEVGNVLWKKIRAADQQIRPRSVQMRTSDHRASAAVAQELPGKARIYAGTSGKFTASDKAHQFRKGAHPA